MRSSWALTRRPWTRSEPIRSTCCTTTSAACSACLSPWWIPCSSPGLRSSPSHGRGLSPRSTRTHRAPPWTSPCTSATRGRRSPADGIDPPGCSHRRDRDGRGVRPQAVERDRALPRSRRLPLHRRRRVAGRHDPIGSCRHQRPAPLGFNPLVERGRLVGTLIGQGEKLFRRVTRNGGERLRLTPRGGHALDVARRRRRQRRGTRAGCVHRPRARRHRRRHTAPRDQADTSTHSPTMRGASTSTTRAAFVSQ